MLASFENVDFVTDLNKETRFLILGFLKAPILGHTMHAYVAKRRFISCLDRTVID